MSGATGDGDGGSSSVAGDSGWVPTVGRWIPVAVLAALLVAMGLPEGTPPPIVGLVGAVALVVARYRLSTPYVLAVGQVALVAALGTASPGPIAVGAEAVLLAGIGLPAGWSPRGRRVTLAMGVALCLLGGVTLGAHLAWDRHWATALVAVGTGGLMGYALHRYEHVRLQVVPSE